MKQPLVLLLLAGAALAQDVPDDAVVATLNGQKFTAGQVKALVRAAPKAVQTYFQQNPKQFLTEHAYYLELLKYAESNGLDKKSPYKEALEFQRMFILTNAALNAKMTSIEVLPEAQQKYYESNQRQFRELRVRMIYFPFTDAATEEEAKSKAAAVAKQAKAGEDFVKLAKENSEDSTGAGADFAVRNSSSQPPAHMKEVLFNQQPGEITEPLRHDNGYYVFRVESADVLPYEKVRDEIYKALKEAQFQQWQNETRQRATVQFENEAFFQSVGQK
jgi:parvulin-like peptidyl-prolyl isomerase